jgi:hypothetical protein
MPEEDASKVEEVALVTGDSVADIVRRGTLAYVDKLRSSSEYAEKATARAAELQQRVQSLLAGVAATSSKD